MSSEGLQRRRWLQGLLLTGSGAALGAPAAHGDAVRGDAKPGAQPALQPKAPPLLLAGSREMPRSLAELLVLARQAPQPWRVGHGSASQREGVADWLRMLGLPPTTPVPFRGGAQLLPALVGARIDLAVAPLAWVAGHGTAGRFDSWLAAHRSGDVVLFLVVSPARLPALPDVPTMDEALQGSSR